MHEDLYRRLERLEQQAEFYKKHASEQGSTIGNQGRAIEGLHLIRLRDAERLDAVAMRLDGVGVTARDALNNSAKAHSRLDEQSKSIDDVAGLMHARYDSQENRLTKQMHRLEGVEHTQHRMQEQKPDVYEEAARVLGAAKYGTMPGMPTAAAYAAMLDAQIVRREEVIRLKLKLEQAKARAAVIAAAEAHAQKLLELSGPTPPLR